MAWSMGKGYCAVDILTWLCLGNDRYPVAAVAGMEGQLMPVDPELLEFYVDTVTIEPFEGDDFDNVPSYGAPVPYRAKIDAKTEEVLRKTGDVAVSTHSIALDDVYSIDPKDRLTMPARFAVRQPEIVATPQWTDEVGPHHTTVKVGGRKGGRA